MRMNGTCYNDHLCQKDASHSLTSKSFISPINGTKEMLPNTEILKQKITQNYDFKHNVH